MATQIKDINFAGQSSVPSDFSAPDGSLSLSHNLIYEDGELHPLTCGTPLAQFPPSANLMLRHKVAGQTNLIFWFNPADNPADIIISWVEQQQAIADPHLCINLSHNPLHTGHPAAINAGVITRLCAANYSNDTPLTIHDATIVGNTLAFATSTGMFYALWENGKYKFLTGMLPKLDVKVSVDTKIFNTATPDQAIGYECPDYQQMIISENGVNILSSDLYYAHYSNSGAFSLDDNTHRRLLEKIYSLINPLINKIKTHGRFTDPFFIQFCYRLYDGSRIGFTTPQLIIPNSACKPLVVLFHPLDINQDGNRDVAVTAAICGTAISLDLPAIPSQWHTIVSGIDILVSEPIVDYSSDGYNRNTDGLVHPTDTHRAYYAMGHNGGKHNIYSSAGYGPVQAPNVTYPMVQILSRADGKSLSDIIADTSLFYCIKSIPIDQLSATSRTPLTPDFNHDEIPNLATYEAVQGTTSNTYDAIIASSLFSFNNRLNAVVSSRTLQSGFPANTFSPGNTAGAVIRSMQIEIEADNALHTLTLDIASTYNDFLNPEALADNLLCFFYPHPKAKKLIVTWSDEENNINKSEIPLKSHHMLSGAYAFENFTPLVKKHITSTTQTLQPAEFEYTPPTPVSLPSNSLILSTDANNPFLFTSSQKIGNGDIYALIPAAKPISQGQFGQFPLYAFTSDGIWALSTASDGSISSVYPVSRDIVLSPKSILQLDSSIIFATARGIMEIAGGQVSCLSNPINAHQDSLHKITLSLNAKFPNTPVISQPLQAFISGCQMVYDYPHQHIFFFNPGINPITNLPYNYSYVYSLRSGAWAVADCGFQKSINAYPDALVIDRNGNLISLSDSPEVHNIGTIISRPIKLDNPYILKSVDTAIVRGMFNPASVSSAVFGSNDLRNWMPISSSSDAVMRNITGSGYKYFRIIVFANNLLADDAIAGVTISFTPRLAQTLR